MGKIRVEINETNFYFLVALCDKPQSSNLGPILAEICINVTSLFINEENKSYFENALSKSKALLILLNKWKYERKIFWVNKTKTKPEMFHSPLKR